MKAAVLHADRTIALTSAPDPRVGPDEVLVQSSHAGICGTDVHIFRGEFHDRVRCPAILGHEFGGTVEELGSNVRGWKRGDRVAVDPIVSCHACPACLEGHINCCANLKLLGIDLPGGFGQYVAVPQHRLFAVPDAVPMRQVSMVEMYGLGHHVLARGRVQPGESVVVLGAGKLGLAVLDVLCHGANPCLTIACDVQPARLAVAARLGADHTVDVARDDPVERVRAFTAGTGADCVIECVGHYHEVAGREAPLAQAVRMIRPGGRVVTAGLGEQLSAVHFKTLVLKEAEIIATRVTAGEFPRALRLLAKGLLHPELLITDELPLRDVASAFATVDRDQADTIKVVLDVQAG
jgi:threonine dehydrogenase-like Zn-dependent dehydrogenase